MNKAVYLKENLDYFRSLEQQLETNPSKKLAQAMINFTQTGCVPIFSSRVLESYFSKLACESATKLNKPTEVLENSFLHVLTQSYLVGGHSRVVERWIESSPSNEKHSIVLLDQEDENQIPDSFSELTNQRNGKLLRLEPQLPWEGKANQLRDIIINYETVVLHHHPHDPVPLMALSHPGVACRVACLNHAGRFFWLGASVIDISFEHEKGLEQITQKYRGIKKTVLHDLPIARSSEKVVDVSKFRRKLKVNGDIKLMITMASPRKYEELDNLSLFPALHQILSKNNQRKLVVIGVDKNHLAWQSIIKQFPQQVICLGSIPHSEITGYLRCANLYIDSYPINSWLSFNDAINLGHLPGLLIQTSFGYPPYLENSSAVCQSIEEFIDKVDLYLSSPVESQRLYEELSLRQRTNCSVENFQLTVHKGLGSVTERSHFLAADNKELEISELSKTSLSIALSKTKCQRILKILAIKKRKLGISVKSFYLLGIYLFSLIRLLDGTKKITRKRQYDNI